MHVLSGHKLKAAALWCIVKREPLVTAPTWFMPGVGNAHTHRERSIEQPMTPTSELKARPHENEAASKGVSLPSVSSWGVLHPAGRQRVCASLRALASQDLEGPQPPSL
mmetsp:Transcript_22998/g.63862  ORF Transcript_22998/g.63862 Transcript_22998/m.63862 type:complete len:109 (-) Transcript_22998:1391-1717(-)